MLRVVISVICTGGAGHHSTSGRGIFLSECAAFRTWLVLKTVWERYSFQTVYGDPNLISGKFRECDA